MYWFFFILSLNNYVQLSFVPAKNRYPGWESKKVRVRSVWEISEGMQISFARVNAEYYGNGIQGRGSETRVSLMCVTFEITTQLSSISEFWRTKCIYLQGCFSFLQSRLRSLSSSYITGISVSFQTAASHKQCEKYSLLWNTIYSYLSIYFWVSGFERKNVALSTEEWNITNDDCTLPVSVSTTKYNKKKCV